MTEPNDFTPYPNRPVPSRQPRLPAPGHLVGQAEGASVRSESHPYAQGRLTTVLTFRLRVPERSLPVEVELRGLSLTGAVRDGDWVEVVDRPGPDGIYAAPTVTNLTTGLPVTVDARSGPNRVLTALFLLVVFLMLAGAGALFALLGE